jgi:hypothetical protein
MQLTQALETTRLQPLSLPLDPSRKAGYKLCSFTFSLRHYTAAVEEAGRVRGRVRRGRARVEMPERVAERRSPPPPVSGAGSTTDDFLVKGLYTTTTTTTDAHTFDE